MAFLTGYASISRRAMTGVIPSIASSHPLANGLLAAYYPAVFPGGTMTNLASPGSGDLVTRGGSPVLTATPEGPGLNCTTANAVKNIQSLNTPIQFQMASGMTAFVRAQWTGYSSSNVPENVFGIVYNNEGTAPFWAWGITTGPPVANGGVLNTVAYIVDQGSATFTNNFGASVSPGNNNMYDSMFIGVAGATDRLYLNGIAQINSAHVSMNANHYGSATPTIMLGNASAQANRTAASIITVAYIWNRILNYAEAQYLHSNPYSLLRWPIDIVYDILERPAQPAPSTSNQPILLSPLAVGLGGAAAFERWLAERKLAIRRLRGE